MQSGPDMISLGSNSVAIALLPIGDRPEYHNPVEDPLLEPLVAGSEL